MSTATTFLARALLAWANQASNACSERIAIIRSEHEQVADFALLMSVELAELADLLADHLADERARLVAAVDAAEVEARAADARFVEADNAITRTIGWVITAEAYASVRSRQRETAAAAEAAQQVAASARAALAAFDAGQEG